jgi:hypothetical protein
VDYDTPCSKELFALREPDDTDKALGATGPVLILGSGLRVVMHHVGEGGGPFEHAVPNFLGHLTPEGRSVLRTALTTGPYADR